MSCEWFNGNLLDIRFLTRVKRTMYEDIQKLYRAYLAGELGTSIPTEEIPPVNQPLFPVNLKTENFELWGFAEKFETNWFNNNVYALLYHDYFEWIEQIGDYSTEITDTFQNDWFTQVEYLENLKNEAFDIEWFIVNDYESSLFIESFEGVWD